MHELNERFKEIAHTYRTPQYAAKAVYKALYKYAGECGMDPDMEVTIRNPKENAEWGCGRCWYVGFEAGDYQWAIGASFILANENWFTEPFYSFDLVFNKV